MEPWAGSRIPTNPSLPRSDPGFIPASTIPARRRQIPPAAGTELDGISSQREFCGPTFPAWTLPLCPAPGSASQLPKIPPAQLQSLPTVPVSLHWSEKQIPSRNPRGLSQNFLCSLGDLKWLFLLRGTGVGTGQEQRCHFRRDPGPWVRDNPGSPGIPHWDPGNDTGGKIPSLLS